MFDIKNNVMRITKGDSAAIKVSLKKADGTAYQMVTGDKLYFSAKKRISGEVLMQIDSTTDTLDFTPSNTQNLEVGEGYCDIQLTTVGGDRFTVWGVTDKPNLIVYPEVTEGV